MKYRLDITPAAVNTGDLIHSEAYAVSLTNRTPLSVELRYDKLVSTGGIVHTPPALPMTIASNGLWQPTLTVNTNGPLRIDGNLQLDFHFNVDGVVAAKKGFGPMIYNGLIVNAYHPEIGRGGYFHPNSGTSEGQGVMILAAFMAYEVLKDDPASAAVAEYYRDLAVSMLDAMSEFDNNGPMLRQPIPDNPEVITLLHWLFAAKGPVQLQTVVLDYVVTLSGNKATIPASQMGQGLVIAYKLYPATSELLYESPYSPVVGGGEVAVAQATENPDGSVTLTANAANGQYKVAYAYYSPTTLPLGSAYEAYPVWSAIPPGYAACAPDTFRWFDMALNKAITLGPAKDAAKWLKLRDALRRTVVKGQNLTDLREVIKPLPLIGVFATDGMFCFSDNPNAKAPTAGSGLDAGWVGYNFWRRDSSTGNIVGEVPLATTNSESTATSSAQIGRGFEDTWRGAKPYQEADQFLLVEMATTLNQNISALASSSTPNFRPFISTTREYDPATRYYAAADSASSGGAWGWNDNGAMRTLLFPRSAFKNEAGQVFPLNGTILNFGLDLRAPATIGYTVALRALRLVSGPSAAWVIANLSEARKGSQLPYFPGAIPFATNADLNAQEFIGYNGNPFHGYQLPDLWLHLEKEAALEHPLLTPADLPTANPQNGEFKYEISPQNANGSAKPTNVLLMEQQLLFLRDAADVWFRDHGVRGPFAHTFVLNTPARFNIGGPEPHTWVYTNDDPNTRWVGYQVRIIESLADIVRQTAGVEYAGDVYALSKTLAVNWLNWLNAAWPNLNGSPYKGVPTDFRATGAPTTEYEETHAPAIILRACVLLKMGASDQNALCDTIMQRCWDYLELNWRTSGEMAYTWSPDPDKRQWYGFWHGEILWTLALMIGEGRAAVAPGIPLATVRQRMIQTQQWLDQYGVLDARHRVEIPVKGFRAEAVGVNPDWSSNYRVIRGYKTDIYTSANGEEQRRALRQTPRKSLEFYMQFTGKELRDFQTTMSVWQNRDFIAPELTKFVRLSTGALAGQSYVDLTAVPSWIVVDALVMLVREGAHEMQVVDAVAGNRVFFTSTLANRWPTRSKLCHGVNGRLQASFNMNRLTNGVATGLLALDVEPGSEPYPTLFEVPTDELFPGLTQGPEMYPQASVPINSTTVFYYDGEEVLLLRNNWGESVTEGRDWPVVKTDFDLGLIETSWDVEYNTRQFSATITCHTPERIEYLQGFFDRMRGAQGNFWMPTWENDLPLAADIVGETQRIVVDAPRTARLLLNNAVYREIAVVTRAGQVYTNSFLTVDYHETVAVLGLRDPWPDSLLIAEVLMVCWMPAWRLSDDEHTFLFLTDSVAQVVIDCQTDKAARYNPDDVAAQRLAVLYTSLPYRQMFADAVTDSPYATELRFSPAPTPSDAVSTITSVQVIELEAIRDPVQTASILDAPIDSVTTVQTISLQDILKRYNPPADELNSSLRPIDGALVEKLKRYPIPDESVTSVTTIRSASLNAE